MYGRYYVEPSQEDEQIRKVLASVEKHYPGQCKTGEINPGDTAAGVISVSNRIVPVPAVFGFPGVYSPGDGRMSGAGRLLINARSETAAKKKLFADHFERRRIILPASGFYEWSMDERKTKYYFELPGQNAVYLCGLYCVLDGACRFVILTKTANASVEEIHERMPVILSGDQVRPYLTDTSEAEKLLTEDGPILKRTALLR